MARRSALLHSASALCFIAALMAMLVDPGSARGDELTKVTLTETGPDRPLPLGKSFTLTGKAVAREPGKGDVPADEIRAYFVRTSYPFFGTISVGTETDCDKVGKALGNPTMPGPTAVGIMSADQIWFHGSKSMDALRLGPWTRTSAKDEAYSILVPEEQAFFRPGATYCLLLYTGVRGKLDSSRLDQAIKTFQETWEKCGADDSQCQSDAIVAVKDAIRAFRRTAEGQLLPAEKDDALKLIDAVDVGMTAAAVIVDNKLRAKLADYSNSYASTPSPAVVDATVGEGTLPIEFHDAATDPLAQLVLTMAASAGEIKASHAETTAADKKAAPSQKPKAVAGAGAANKDATPKGAVEFRLADDTKIDHVGIGPGNKLYVVTGPLSGAIQAKRFPVEPSKLLFPESTISLGDLLDYSYGRVKVGSSAVPFGEIYKNHLKALLTPPFTADPKTAQGLDEHLIALSAVMKKALGFENPSSAPALAPAQTTTVRIYGLTGTWLKASVLKVCDGKSAKKECTDKPAGNWAGLTHFDDTPIAGLSNTLHLVVAKAVAAGEPHKKVEEIKTKPTHSLVLSVGTNLRLTKETWFAQFITPAVGVGWITGATFAVQYGGIKLYGFPNPIDEPMWINGFEADLRRVLSLEVGLVANSGNIGPGGRFTGLDGGKFPPILLGGALQLAPYISLSGGFSFFSARRSTLLNEAPRLFVSPYVGLSGDLNFLDLIATALGKARASKVDSITNK